MKAILIYFSLLLIAQASIASESFKFKSPATGVSNEALYESLVIRETLKSKGNEKGKYKKRDVSFSVSNYIKATNLVECSKVQYTLNTIEVFARYSCQFKIQEISFVESNKVRPKSYFGIKSKDNSLEKYLFQASEGSRSKTLTIDNRTIVTKSFGKYKLKRTSYNNKSLKTSYSFYIEI